MMTTRSRTAATFAVEVSFLLAFGSGIALAGFADPAHATTTSPVQLTTIAAPAGVTVDSPWAFLDGTRTEWALGSTTSTGNSVLLSRNIDTGTITTTAQSAGEDGTTAIAVDPSSGILALSVKRSGAGNGNRIAFIDTTKPNRTGSYQMASTETAIRAMVFGKNGGSLFIGSTSSPAKVYKIASGSATLTSSTSLPSGVNNLSSALRDGTTLYFTSTTNPVSFVTFSTGTMSVDSVVPLPATIPTLVDPLLIGSLAYYGSDGNPGTVTAIDVKTGTVHGILSFPAGETGARALTLDGSTGILYALTTTATGTRVVAIDSATLTRLGSSDLGTTGNVRSASLTGHELRIATTGSTMMRTLTVAPAPAAPMNASIIEDNKRLTVLWEAPASVETVTGYTVTATRAGYVPLTCHTSSTSCTFDSLSNGATYDVRIVATSIAGTGTPADLRASPRTLPEAPSHIIAQRGDRRIEVTWDEPDWGGRPLTGYTVTLQPGGALCTSTIPRCTITNVVNGTAYSVSVTATTEVGTSPNGTMPGTITPATIPAPVQDISATRGNRSAVVTWEAPLDNGGSEVTTFSVNGADGTLLCQTTETSCTIDGLHNGTTYRFAVRAINEVGPSLPRETDSVTPATNPGEISAVNATEGDRSISLVWEAPLDDGGSAVIDYEVRQDDGTALCVTAERRCLVAGLHNGTAYRFTLVARNDVGYGTPVSTAWRVPGTAPSTVHDVFAVPGDSAATIRWSRPADDGGFPALVFDVLFADGTPACTTIETECVVTGIANDHSYTFIVIARNERGSADPSEESNSVTPHAPAVIPPPAVPPTPEPTPESTTAPPPASPSPQPTPLTPAVPVASPIPTETPNPVVVHLTVPGTPAHLASTWLDKRTLHIVWVAPSNGGSPITGYRLESRAKAKNPFRLLAQVSGPQPRADIARPAKAGALFLRVLAINAIGPSLPSPEIKVKMK